MTLRVRNWSRFQHFRDRRPPWIKLHREVLEQRDIAAISDRAFRVLIGLWLLASEDRDRTGALPPVGDIAFRLRMPEANVTACLAELSGFLVQDDIKAISGRYQDDAPETETETETEPPNPPAGGTAVTVKTGRRTRPAKADMQKKATENPPGLAIIGSWFGRRPGTMPTVAELYAYRSVSPLPREVQGMGWYYTASEEEAAKVCQYRRKSVMVLLNNWSGELDKARAFAAVHPELVLSAPESWAAEPELPRAAVVTWEKRDSEGA